MLSQDTLVANDNTSHSCRTQCYLESFCTKGPCCIRNCHVAVHKLPQRLEEKLHKCPTVNLGNTQWLTECFGSGSSSSSNSNNYKLLRCSKTEKGHVDDDSVKVDAPGQIAVELTVLGMDDSADDDLLVQDILQNGKSEGDVTSVCVSPKSKVLSSEQRFPPNDDRETAKGVGESLKSGHLEKEHQTNCNHVNNNRKNSKKDDALCNSKGLKNEPKNDGSNCKKIEPCSQRGEKQKNKDNMIISDSKDPKADLKPPVVGAGCGNKKDKPNKSESSTTGKRCLFEVGRRMLYERKNSDFKALTSSIVDSVNANSNLKVTNCERGPLSKDVIITNNDTHLNHNQCSDQIKCDLSTDVINSPTIVRDSEMVVGAKNSFTTGNGFNAKDTSFPESEKSKHLTDETNPLIKTSSSEGGSFSREPLSSGDRKNSLSTDSDSTLKTGYCSGSETKDILSQVIDEVFFGDESNEAPPEDDVLNEGDMWAGKPETLHSLSFGEEVHVSKSINSTVSQMDKFLGYESHTRENEALVEEADSFLSDKYSDDVIVHLVMAGMIAKVAEKIDSEFAGDKASPYMEDGALNEDNAIPEEIQNVGSTDSDFLSMRLSDCETKDESCSSSRSLYFSDSDVDDCDKEEDHANAVSDSVVASTFEREVKLLNEVLGDDTKSLESKDVYANSSQTEALISESKCLSPSDKPVDLTLSLNHERTCTKTDEIKLNADNVCEIDKNERKDSTDIVRQGVPSPKKNLNSNDDCKDCDGPINLICDNKNSTTCNENREKFNTEINNNVIMPERFESDLRANDSKLERSVSLSSKDDVYTFSEAHEEVKEFRHSLSRSMSFSGEIKNSEESYASLSKRPRKEEQSSPQKRYTLGNLRQHIKEDWLKRKPASKTQEPKDNISTTSLESEQKKMNINDKINHREANKTIYSIVNDGELSGLSETSIKETEGKVPKLLIAKGTCSMSKEGNFVSKVIDDHKSNGKLSLEKVPLKLSFKRIQRKRKNSKDELNQKSSPETSSSEVKGNASTKDDILDKNLENENNCGLNGLNSSESESDGLIEKEAESLDAYKSSNTEETSEKLEKDISLNGVNDNNKCLLKVPKLVPISKSRSPSPSLLCYTRVDDNHVIKSVNLEENELERKPDELSATDKVNEEKVVKNLFQLFKKVEGVQWKNGRRVGALTPISHDMLEKMAVDLGKEFDFDDEDVESFKESAKSILTIVETVRKKRRKKTQKGLLEKPKKIKMKSIEEEQEKDLEDNLPALKNLDDDIKDDERSCDTMAELYDDDDNKDDKDSLLSPSIASGDTEIDFSEDGDYFPTHSERLKNALRRKRRRRNQADLEGMLTRMRSLRNRGGNDVLSVDFDNPIPLEYTRRRRNRRQRETKHEMQSKLSKNFTKVKKIQKVHTLEKIEPIVDGAPMSPTLMTLADKKPLKRGPKGKLKRKVKTIKNNSIGQYKYQPSKVKEDPQAAASYGNIVKRRFFKSRLRQFFSGEESQAREENNHNSDDPLLDLRLAQPPMDEEPSSSEFRGNSLCQNESTSNLEQDSGPKDLTNRDMDFVSEEGVHKDNLPNFVNMQVEHPLDLSRKNSSEILQDKLSSDALEGANSENETPTDSRPVVDNDLEDDDLMRDDTSPLPAVPSGILSGKSDDKQSLSKPNSDKANDKTNVSEQGAMSMTVETASEDTPIALPKITSVVSLANSCSEGELVEQANPEVSSVTAAVVAPETISTSPAYLNVGTQPSSFTGNTPLAVPAIYPKIAPSKQAPLSGGGLLLPSHPVGPMPHEKDVYNAQYERLKTELITLEMVARQKEKERNNILKLKQYKQSVMRKLQLKKALLQHQQKQQGQMHAGLLRPTYQSSLPLSPIARHPPVIMASPNGHLGQLLNPLSLTQTNPISASSPTATPAIFIAPPIIPVSLHSQSSPLTQESSTSSPKDAPKRPSSATESNKSSSPKDKVPSVSAVTTIHSPSDLPSSQAQYVFHQDWDKRLKVVPRNDFSSGLSSVETIVAKANENFGLQFQGWMEDSQGMLHPYYQRTPYTGPGRPIAPKLVPSSSATSTSTTSAASSASGYYINPITNQRLNERRPIKNLDDVIRNVYSRKLSSPTVTSSLPPYLAQSSLYGNPILSMSDKPEGNQKREKSPAQQQLHSSDSLSPSAAESSVLSSVNIRNLNRIQPSGSIMSPTSSNIPSNSTLAKLLLSPLPESSTASKISGTPNGDVLLTDSRKTDVSPEFKEPLSTTLSNLFDNKLSEKSAAPRWPYCGTCRSHFARFICAGCNNQWYCSEPCQVKDWKYHFKMCRR